MEQLWAHSKSYPLTNFNTLRRFPPYIIYTFLSMNVFILYTMVFVCASIRTADKVLKPWYARTIVDGSQSLGDLFASFACGEFDQGKTLPDQYQTAQVSS